jgi:Flp pilus assembly protein TadG
MDDSRTEQEHSTMIIKNQISNRRSGVTLVESAVVISAALFFMFAIFEWSRLVMVQQVCENSAREGARFAVVHTQDKTTAQIQAQVLNYMGGTQAQLPDIQILVYQVDPNTGANIGAWNNAAFGKGIAVEITGTYTPVLPSMMFFNQNVAILGGPVAIDIRSVMYSEAN